MRSMIQQDGLVEMLSKFHNNIEELYKNAAPSVETPNNKLSAAYKELGTASEELQIAIEELVIKSEELAATRMNLESERQHYKNLFEFLPDAYIITNPQGNILQANQASAALFNIEPRFLTNKPLDIFLAQEDRQLFNTKLNQLHHSRQGQKLTLHLQPRQGDLIETAVTVAPNYNNEGKLVAIHWSLRKQSKSQQTPPWLINNNDQLSQKYPKYVYQQGENISLHPDNLWLVDHGWVKLTTMLENGEEILIGLVGESMPFGSSLTSLPTYQAIALSSRVQLVSLPLTELYNSSNLAEAIFPQIIERLKHTESMLAISGVRQVHQRVHHLLLWLKENFGQKVAQGYRLRVRLTHQELANACSTTRVTITRVLSQLRKQGKIIYDSKHHIIFISDL